MGGDRYYPEAEDERSCDLPFFGTILSRCVRLFNLMLRREKQNG
jgi:hypothetical protein